MYKKILVPLDGSEHALKALAFAIDLAEKYDATLSLLYVVTSQPVPDSIGDFGDWVYEREAGVKLISACEKQASDHGLKSVESSVRKGQPGQVIVDVAKDTDVDLIIMGTRGLSDMQGLLMGSVAHKVSHLAHCTVVTVR